MRISIITVSFLLCTMLFAAGCASTPWHKPDVGDSTQAAGLFDVDSHDCDLEARDEYPIDKDGQRRVYDVCMERKGWSKRDGTKAVNFR